MSVKWVGALSDNEAKIVSSQQLACLIDNIGDGEIKLILIDISNPANPSLKLFKGISLIGQSIIGSFPCKMISFYNNPLHISRSPNIAIASQDSIYFYKNMKPFYKFPLPPLVPRDVEVDLWKVAKSHKITIHQLSEAIAMLRESCPFDELAAHTQIYCMLNDDEDRKAFVQHVKIEAEYRSTVTCLISVRRNESVEIDVEVIVIGTEHRQIIFVDTQAIKIIKILILPGVPTLMTSEGGFDIDCKIFLLTRDNEVFVLKKNSVTIICKLLLTLPRTCSTMVRQNNKLIFATMDNVIYYYTTKGKKIHEFTPGGDITCIEPFFYNPKQYYGLFVVVGNEIRLYIDYLLVDRIKSEAQVSWIKFGGLGREEAVLIIVSKTGSLAVKMFKRTAVLDDKEFLKNNGGLQVMKLTIPKKTKAFVSQGMREKTNADLIFKIFQRDLFMLKLYITKSYAELQSSNLASLGFSDDFSAIEVQVDVLGFGPMFRVVINMSSGKKITLRNLKIMFSYNKDLYSMKNDIIDICYLLPNYPQSLVVPVEAKQLATGQSGDICMKIMESYQLPALIPPSKQKPLVTHAFTMPVCETDFLE